MTVRALRHYEEIDLLVPEIVDRDTGYRYYAVGQLQKIQSITMLKSLGYSLEEIRDLWDDESHFPSVESLEQKILACEEELAVHAAGGSWPICKKKSTNYNVLQSINMDFRKEAIECVKDHVLSIHKQIYVKYDGDT